MIITIGETLALGLVLCAIGALLIIAVRRYLLERGGGTVECHLRRGDGDDWRIGLGRYAGDELRWYRIFDLRPRPNMAVSRRGLVVSGRRPPDESERSDLPSDVLVVDCRWPATGRSVELAMGDLELTGFLAWAESSPPGTPTF
ncbi:MAG: DUF2550 family protein [Streptosporangiales bacterium]|nr:DUF2550 family protein [Streptosporangiales bacterium]